MEFKASLDPLAKAVGIIVSFILLVFIAYQIEILFESKEGMPGILVALTLFVFLVSIAYRPKGYVLTERELIVRRSLFDVRIPRSNIQSVEIIGPEFLRGSIRLFGVGGLFGYYGKFANLRLGSMTWYATRRDQAVLIRTTNKKKIILTPDEPEVFVEALINHLPGSPEIISS